MSPVPWLPAFTEARRSDGLRVVVAEDRSVPLVHLLGVLPAGARYDPAGLGGLAALTARLVCQGTLHRGAERIAEEAEDLGADVVTGADWDTSYTTIELMAEDVEPGIDLLADLLWSPALSQAAVEAEQRERIARIESRRSDPSTLANLWLARLLYAGTTFGRPLEGSAETVARLTREHVARFHRSRYRPAQAVLIAAGDNRDDLVQRLLEAAPTIQGSAPDQGEPAAGSAGPARSRVFVVDLPWARQTEMRAGQACVPAGHPDLPALQLLCSVLSQRLRLALRECRGWTYHVNCRLSVRGGSSLLSVAAALANDHAAEAARILRDEAERLRQEPVPAAELREARSRWGSSLFQRAQTLHGWAALFKPMAAGLSADSGFKAFAELKRLNPEDLLDTARRHLAPDRFGWVVAGPAAGLEGHLSELGEPFEPEPLGSEQGVEKCVA